MDEIKPKKLQNPIKDSKLRQNLHKEMMFDFKAGKSLQKKTELQKTIEQIKSKKDVVIETKKDELELVLEERKKFIEDNQMFKEEAEEEEEFFKIHRKIAKQQ